MEFITTDGKLELEGTIVKQKRLTTTRKRNIFLYIFFLLFFIDVFLERLERAQLSDKISRWVGVTLYGSIILIYLLIFLDFIFRQYLKPKLDIQNIKKIKVFKSDDELETNLRLSLHSGRYKIYKFRTLEKQAEPFLETILSLNSKAILVKE